MRAPSPESKSKKAPPRFASEAAERRFWASHDAAEYFDWKGATKPTLPNLRPTTIAISIRLPIAMLEELKALANGMGVPYQALMKVFLSERIARERGGKMPS